MRGALYCWGVNDIVSSQRPNHRADLENFHYHWDFQTMCYFRNPQVRQNKINGSFLIPIVQDKQRQQRILP